MSLVVSNRNKIFSDEMDHMSNQAMESMDDGILESMDEKRIRKAVFRRTIDYNSSVTLQQEQRLFRRLYSHRNALQPDLQYQHLLTPPQDYKDNPMNCVCVKHVRTSTNKNKCPIYSVCWTPDGRRLITAASSGEFTLWNGLTFNFETILQAHDTYIKAMKWSHNEDWLLSGDDLGMVKYWQANMNDVNVFQAHKDAIRGLSFCPSDKKFVTCSVDNTVRIWDFQLCKEERVLRGHGGEVKCVAWHPTKALVMSGSKDSQQPLKLWDPKAGECISTMYVHKSSCNDIAINKNGNWFLSASKDHTIKLFDLRNLKSEMQVFRGHKKDVFRVAWNPFHENLFASGSGDGALMYWMAGTDMEVGSVDDAHDNIIWSIDWHPMGHILATGSNDFATKFWTRNRPGDVLKDNQQVDHNVSTAKSAVAAAAEVTHSTDLELDKIIKRVKNENSLEELDLQRLSSSIEADLEKSEKILSDIPGLSEGLMRDIDVDTGDSDSEDRDSRLKGTSYRVIPKQFVLNWADKKRHPAAYIPIEPHRPLIVVPPPVTAAQLTAKPLEPLLHRSPITAPPSKHKGPAPPVPPSPQGFVARPTESTSPKSYHGEPRVPPVVPLMSTFPTRHGREPFPNQQRRQSPDFIDNPPNRFIKTESCDSNDLPPNHNGQHFAPFQQRAFRPSRPFNNMMHELGKPRNVDSGDEDFEDDEEEYVEDDDDFFGRRPIQYDHDLPRYAAQNPRQLPRNIHPSNPDFLFERPHQRPSLRGFHREGSFRAAHPNQRMFPPNQSDNRYDMQYQRPPGRFNAERSFAPSQPLQRPPPRHFRPQSAIAPTQMDLQHSHPRLPRQFQPNHSEGPFHPQNQRLPGPPRPFLPSAPGQPIEPQQHSQRPTGPLSQSRNNTENPFEPQKSTGSSKAFIPLPNSGDEPANKRNRSNIGNRPGPNW